MTSQLMCFLLYLGYLLVRPAIAEPTQRASISAFVAINAAAPRNQQEDKRRDDDPRG